MTEKNKIYLTDEQRETLHLAAKQFRGDFIALRRIVIACGVTKDTLVKPVDFPLMQRIAALCYNPLDKGINGKMQEVEWRCERYDEINRAMRWGEFFARKAGRVDNCAHGIKFEDKSGAGDWLRSRKAQTREEAIAEYRNRKDWVRWVVADCDICFICPWPVFFNILDGYNEKGCAQFFKSNVKFVENGMVVQLQEFRTSKKKMAWLAAHSIDMRNIEDGE